MQIKRLWPLFLASALGAAAEAATLEVSPAEATTGVGGRLHLTALYDPDGPGPLPLVDVTTSTVFAAPGGAVSLFRTAFDGLLALGLAEGSAAVTATYAGLDASASIQVAGRVFTAGFTHEGRARTFRYYLPASLPPGAPAPVLLALHGGGGDGPAMEALTNYNALAAEEAFVAVYPDGVDNHWNDGRNIADYLSHQENVDDVGFLAEVLRRVGQETPVDAERVYVTGMSNGSLMSKRFICERSDLVAAVGTVGATLPRNILGGCRLERPVPLLHIHGTADQHAFYAGGDQAGGDTLSVPELMAFWRGKNGCAGPVGFTALADSANDGTATRVESAACAEERRAALYRVEGAGHTWPGGLQYFPEENPAPLLAIGKTSRDFSASREIWNFLKTKRLSAGSPPPKPDPARAYPVPFRAGAGILTFDRLPAGAHVRVYTSAGDLVYASTADGSGQLLWNGRNAEGRLVAGGVYLVHVRGGGDKLFKIAVLR